MGIINIISIFYPYNIWCNDEKLKSNALIITENGYCIKANGYIAAYSDNVVKIGSVHSWF